VSRAQRSTSRAFTPVFAGYGDALCRPGIVTNSEFRAVSDQRCHSAPKTRVNALMAPR
jgi:hypothetical protein